VQHLFHYLVKQPTAAYGPTTLAELRRTFADQRFNVRKLMVTIAVESARNDRKVSMKKENLNGK
jgi:hypothetical protein